MASTLRVGFIRLSGQGNKRGEGKYKKTKSPLAQLWGPLQIFNLQEIHVKITLRI